MRARYLRWLRNSGLVLALGLLPLASSGGDEKEQLSEAAQGRAVTMRSFVISATRIDRNPWRYGTLAGFEILSRASNEETQWLMDALQRGAAIEAAILPPEWLAKPAVPYTVIIDDTDLRAIEASQLRSQQVEFRTPEDSSTWGGLSDQVMTWSDRFEAHDADTYATNTDVFGVGKVEACFMSLERALRCRPPLPNWLLEGLMEAHYGLFRESFMPHVSPFLDNWVDSAQGPGTLWISLDETDRLVKDLAREKKDRNFKAVIPWLPLGELFAEKRPPKADLALWKSEAALFARWGLMGPGRGDPRLFHAFVQFAEQARMEPVTEADFAGCFGFGYREMETRLLALLREVLSKPTSVEVSISSKLPEADLEEATADQIGRILGDWLRMEGNAIRTTDPAEGQEYLYSAGRMLERAYRDDNGLPPDVNPAQHFGSESADRKPEARAAGGGALVMKPFVVSSTRIHDARLLATYGMYEHDAGEDDLALDLLSTALAEGVVRPQAAIDLAQIRFAKATQKPLGAGGRISKEQVLSVVEPLVPVLEQASSAEPYWIMAKAWEASDAKPTPNDIGLLTRGVRLFPRFTNIAYRAALVSGRSGYLEAANAMIESGKRFVVVKADLAEFERLRSTFPSPRTADAR